MRMQVKSLAVAAAAVGALAVAGAPASAATTAWQPTPTSNLTCGQGKQHPGGIGVSFTTCVRYEGGYAQAVLSVTSFGIVPSNIDSGEVKSTFGSNATCGTSTVGPGVRRSCIGPKFPRKAPPTQLPTAKLVINGVERSYP
ncbi:hypothetical protein [Streptomyces sp. NPDC048057]|uniref:hypothetical protein n=1 Tax=Streptomyces sp. NPDC048057 TaxID=3155628 RepID=UPI0033CFAC5E